LVGFQSDQIDEGPNPFDQRRDADQSIVAAGEVRACARPRPVLCPRDQPRPHRIEGDVTRRGDQMRFVERHRGEPALKQMSGPSRAGIDEARILPVRLADRTREPVGRTRRKHEMDVVGHQAIGPHLDRRLAATLGEQVAIERVIRGLEEDLLAPVAALGYVVRKARDDDTADARHTAYRDAVRKLLQWVRCPRNSK
jgi:hypothetical protein